MRKPPLQVPRSRGFRRIARTLGGVLGTLTVLVLGTATGLVVHLNHPAARRIVRHGVNRVLAETLRGTIVIDRLERIEVFSNRLQGIDVTILDPEGHSVVVARGISGQVAVRPLLLSLIGQGPLAVSVEQPHIESVDVTLRKDANGILSLESTFEPRMAPAPTEAASSQGIELVLDGLTVQKARALGQLEGAPVDMDVDALSGDLRLDQSKLSATLRPLAFHARALPIPARAADGVIEGKVTVPLTAGQPTELQVEGALRAGGLRGAFRGSLHGNAFTADLDLPMVSSQALSAVVEGLPLNAPVSSTVEAWGTLQEVKTRGRISLGAGHLEFDGNLGDLTALPAQFSAKMSAKAVNLSLADCVAGSPPGVINAEVNVGAMRMPGSPIQATYDWSSAPTVIAGQPIPALTTRGALDGRRLVGKAKIDEPGTLTTVAYALGPEQHRPNDYGLDADLSVVIPRIERLSRIRSKLRGRAAIQAKGHLTLDRDLAISGEITATGAGLDAGPVTVSDARLTAAVGGSARSPMVHATVQARELLAWGSPVTRSSLTVNGGVQSSRVHWSAEAASGDMVDATGKLRVGETIALSDVDARLVRNGEEVRLRASSARMEGASYAVDGLVLEGGGGSLVGEGNSGRGGLRVKLASTALSLARLRGLIGPSMPRIAGRAEVNIDLLATPAGIQGFARVAGQELELTSALGLRGELPGAQVSGEITFRGRSAVLRGAAHVPGFGTVDIASDSLLFGDGLLSGAAYRSATGTLDARASVELARLDAVLPEGMLPFERLAGTARLTARVSRQNASIPDIDLSISSSGLEIEGRTVAGVPGVQLLGVDVALTGSHLAHSGVVAFDLLAIDSRGELAALQIQGKPALIHLFSAPDLLREDLLRTEFELQARVPRRELSLFPPALRWKQLRGKAALDVSVSGTARDPKALLTLRASEVNFGRQNVGKPPFDVSLNAAFANSHGSTLLEIASDGRSVLTARGDGTLEIADLLEGRGDAPRWRANGDLMLSALPLRRLQALSLLVGQPLGGCVSGSLTLRDLHQDARLDADLRIGDLRVGQVSIGAANLTVHAGRGFGSLDAHLAQERGDLTAKAGFGLIWGNAMLPSWDGSREASGTLLAKDFQLTPLQPFMRGALGKVDGILDANLTYHQGPSQSSAGSLQGEVTVREGVIDAVQLGQELRSVQAKLKFLPSGEVRLSNASARGIAGRVVLEGLAHFAGTTFRDAKGTVRIAHRDEMPLTYQGVELGSGWGDLDLTAKNDEQSGLLLDVSVPRFSLELPDAVGRASQSLDEEPTVKIGSRATGRFVALQQGPLPKTPASVETAPRAASQESHAPSQGSPNSLGQPVVVLITLGQKVRIYRANTIDTWISGKLRARARGGRLSVSGGVQVDRGFLEIQGRRFSIERATASFDPARPPGDPTILATAVYEAPDATLVYADFAGTASKGKLQLHSDPALTQPEILSLVVFGTREGGDASKGNSSAGAAGTAAGLGGGLATQGLNKALADITPVEITTRVDTSDSQDPRPEVAVAITNDVSATVWYRLGVPLPGQNPDRSMLRLDYRFRPRWSLESSVGDKGTSIVDIYWKRRY